jgi:uncharacterized protein YecT (DUF1311 family)
MMILALLLAAAGQAPQLDCKDPQTQSAMTECESLRFKRADAALNRQWAITKAAVARQDGDYGANDKRGTDSAALLASQRAWLAYRDAECKIEGFAMRGGTGEPMLVAGCMADLTQARTKQLTGLVPQH